MPVKYNLYQITELKQLALQMGEVLESTLKERTRRGQGLGHVQTFHAGGKLMILKLADFIEAIEGN